MLSRLSRRVMQALSRGKASLSGAPGIVPFVILCGERTGSTLLVELLDQHPNLRVYNEPFNGLRGIRDPVRGRRFHDTDDGAWAIDTIYRRRTIKPYTAVGFKMIHTHAPAGPLHTAWRRLAEMKNLIVVDLMRENLLEVMVSHRIADFTGRWRSTVKGSRPDPGPVFLSPYDCMEYFERCGQLRENTLALFPGQTRIRITYEELRGNAKKVLDELWPVLGVSAFEPSMALFKQESRPMHERIENYTELREFMRETPHAKYFD